MKRTAALLLAVGMLAGCSSIKRFSYEGSSRDEWQQPERVIAALGIRPGDRVADLGSGSGYFTLRLVRAVGPDGKVYAVDVGGVDLVVVGTYHHLEDRPAYFRNLLRDLAPGGRVAVIDYDGRKGWFVRLLGHTTPHEDLLREMGEAGYEVAEEFDFIDRQSFVIFRQARRRVHHGDASYHVTRALRFHPGEPDRPVVTGLLNRSGLGAPSLSESWLLPFARGRRHAR